MSRWWILLLAAITCAAVTGIICPAYSIEPVGDPSELMEETEQPEVETEADIPPEIEEEIEIDIEALEEELGEDAGAETEYEEETDKSEVQVIVEELEEMKFLEEQQKKIEAKQHAQQAEIDMKKLLFKAAYELYRDAVALDPANLQYRNGMQKALIKYLQELMSQKKYDEAILVAGDVLAEDPENQEVDTIWQEATRLKRGVEDVPPGLEIAEIFRPGIVAEEITAEGLIAEAKELIAKNNFLDAREKLEEAHKLDLINVEIDRLIDECNYRLMLARRDRKFALRQERIQEVYQRWDDRPTWPVSRAEAEEDLPPPISERKQKILEQLDLIVPEISFTEATLESVLNWIREYADLSIWVDPGVWAPPETGLEAPSGFGSPFEETYSEGPFGAAEPGPPGFGAPAAPGVPGAGFGQPQAAPTVPLSYSDPKANDITLKLSHIPIRELLRYVLLQKNLTYRVEDYAVVILRPGTIRIEEMETEIFRLSVVGVVSGGAVEGRGAAGMGIPAPGTGGAGGFGGGGTYGPGSTGIAGGVGREASVNLPAAASSDIKQFLLQSGVPWPPGSNIQPIPSAGMVIVTNTPSNLATVRELINIWNLPPLQVEVEAKFASILHDRIYENSFNIDMSTFNIITDSDKITGINEKREPADFATELAKTRHFEINAAAEQIISTVTVAGRSDPLLSVKGILTKPEFEILWYALDQREYTDLLSVPRVTTISGNTAYIRVEEVFEYPGEWEIEEIDITFESGSTGVDFTLPEDFVPFAVVGTDFEEAHVGVTLNVTPTVGADRKTITLDIVPQVTNLVKWIDYGGASFIPVRKPVFQVEEVETRVYIHDNETVILGGLITEITTTSHDKVPFFGDIPFVGRLFRGESEDTVKRNLIIFVTARLVTSRGTLLNPSRETAQKLSATDEGSMPLEDAGVIVP